VGTLLKVGCFGVIGLIVLIVACTAIVSNQPKPQQQVSGESPAKTDPNKPALAKVGQTATLRGWELTLSDFGPYERFEPAKPPVTKAQGVLLVGDMRIKNIQTSTSNFTMNDFSLKSADGREFKAAVQTATIERGFMITQIVQPGLTTENRVVFDVDPTEKAITFTGLGMQFDVQVP
jgi:hypothetical protein